MSSLAHINYQWCVDNPKHYAGYSDSSWGINGKLFRKIFMWHMHQTMKMIWV